MNRCRSISLLDLEVSARLWMGTRGQGTVFWCCASTELNGIQWCREWGCKEVKGHRGSNILFVRCIRRRADTSRKVLHKEHLSLHGYLQANTRSQLVSYVPHMHSYQLAIN